MSQWPMPGADGFAAQLALILGGARELDGVTGATALDAVAALAAADDAAGLAHAHSGA